MSLACQAVLSGASVMVYGAHCEHEQNAIITVYLLLVTYHGACEMYCGI